MTWDRIEAMSRGLDLDEGVRARVADPFWMMGRQWQVGEFRGDDAARPVSVEMVSETVPLSAFRGATGGTAQHPLPKLGDGTRPPLERLAEEMAAPQTAMTGMRRAAEMGLDLHRRLAAAGFNDLALWLQGECGFAAPPDGQAGTGRTRAALRLLMRRAIDARRVTGDRATALDQRIATMQAAAAQHARRVIEGWTADHGLADGRAYVPERLEYRFSVAGMSAQAGELVLTAPEHSGGDLDWYRFDMGGASLGLGKDDAAGTRQQTSVAVPTPVAFAGMPASRWWEIEDRAVHMGDIQAGPGDFARLMVAEFATTYSDDWFVMPLRVARGALVRVTGLKVFDNFDADPVVIRPAGEIDRGDDPDNPVPRVFRLFEFDGDAGAAGGAAPWLLVGAGLASTQSGPALEKVELARDEGANLAWGIERVVEGPLARPVDRGREWFAGQTEPPARPEMGEWSWQLAGEMPPPWWIPFLPERVSDDGAMRLRRGRMQQWDSLDPGVAGAQGAILAPDAGAFHLEEEEVPRAGIIVERGYQFARAADGSAQLWLRIVKRRGRGERASGLRWDRIAE